jgi:hypothetical protein
MELSVAIYKYERVHGEFVESGHDVYRVTFHRKAGNRWYRLNIVVEDRETSHTINLLEGELRAPVLDAISEYRKLGGVLRSISKNHCMTAEKLRSLYGKFKYDTVKYNIRSLMTINKCYKRDELTKHGLI